MFIFIYSSEKQMTEAHLFLLRIPAILIALTVHEYAHGYVAWWKGDNTAKAHGRLTFNPLAHLDVFGTLMLFFGPFGWAKPVPVNPMNLDNPKRDMIYVGAAGPLSNIVLAIFFGIILRLIKVSPGFLSFSHLFIIFLQLCVLINLGLSFFNLLPIPPLDGSNILLGLLPADKIGTYLRYVQHAPKVLLGLLLAEWVLHIPLFSTIIYPLWIPYMTFWQFVIFGGKAF
jgi:Zn-dependent protease